MENARNGKYFVWLVAAERKTGIMREKRKCSNNRVKENKEKKYEESAEVGK